MSWITLLCLLAVPAIAADQLEEIEVKASKESKKFTFGSVEEVTEADMERKPLPLLANQLDNITGLTLVQSGGPGNQTSVFMRGTESRHVSFTLDSLRVNDSSNDARSYNAAYLTTPFIAGMTVFKGPQSVLFGSDALGGLIDLRTRKGENAPETRVNVMGGSFGTYQASVGKDWLVGNNRGTVTVTQFRTDGISQLNKKRHKATERDGAESIQGTSSSTHRWANKFQTDLLLSFNRGTNEYDGFGADTSKEHAKSDQYILQQKTNYEIDKSSAISLRNGMSRHQRYYYTSQPTNWYEGNLVQNELVYRKEMNNFSLLSGLVSERETMDQRGGPEKGFTVNSLFVQSGYKLGDLKFQAGLRGEDHSRYGNFLIGSAGVNYQVKNNIFGIQYSQGYKAPSLYQLYAPDAFGFGGGNKDLEPERNNSWEARWKYDDSTYEGEVSFFRNSLSNLVTYVGNFGATIAYENQGRLRTEGVELATAVKNKQFKVRPSFIHQQFKDYATTVLRRPQNTAQVQMLYTPVESSEFSVVYRWIDARRDTGSVKLNSYEVVNAGYRYIKESFDFSVQILNVLDREYEDIAGFNVMPRSYFAGMGYRFH